MRKQLVQVPPPKADAVDRLIAQCKSKRYVGFYVEALHKWFCDKDIADAVALFCCERDGGNDGFGYGARDIGSQYPLYDVTDGMQKKRQIGFVYYNGNVKSTEVLS